MAVQMCENSLSKGCEEEMGLYRGGTARRPLRLPREDQRTGQSGDRRRSHSGDTLIVQTLLWVQGHCSRILNRKEGSC